MSLTGAIVFVGCVLIYLGVLSLSVVRHQFKEKETLKIQTIKISK